MGDTMGVGKNGQKPVVVIGAGIGGLTTAALLLKAGLPVVVLEAHVYAGGCAGTFYHKGFRFDAGATLAGGFAPGGPHARLAEWLDLTWPVHPVDPAWVVHLPDRSVTQWADAEQWQTERQTAFPNTEPFWHTQELLADLAWDISTRHFPWPPQSAREAWALVKALRPHTLRATPYLLRSVAALASTPDPIFKTFLDAQLLISAQTTSDYTHALYGSAALDLPRRGVNYVQGGMGALAQTLVQWIRAHGGEIMYRQPVEQIEVRSGRAMAVRTTKGLRLECDQVVANLTPASLAHLLGEATPAHLKHEAPAHGPQALWGAFTLYAGVQADRLPRNLASHHQVVIDPTQPLGEGNSVFISLSEATDTNRAPAGQRAVTLSTHTRVEPWWALKDEEAAYQDRKALYTERILTAAERAVPGLRHALTFSLPGTPLSFEFFTRRPFGWVGGAPQTSLFTARGPRTGLPNVWLVGDSIFPGQSTAGVTLGAWRVATALLATRPRFTPALNS